MLPDVRKYLFDIQKACQLLAEFTAGRTFDDYATDALLRSAVERQFAIIGEAVAQVMRLDPDLATAISESKRIIAFRNILIHSYATVSDEVVWGILETDLPRLREEVNTLWHRNLPAILAASSFGSTHGSNPMTLISKPS
ncbi:MAG: DUF86 domain-containing protein [Chloroflexi bacterium]|nr:DUF86 domain-containing protein [Chloroflexota bacterium]